MGKIGGCVHSDLNFIIPKIYQFGRFYYKRSPEEAILLVLKMAKNNQQLFHCSSIKNIGSLAYSITPVSLKAINKALKGLILIDE